jgi:hypothetical protein
MLDEVALCRQELRWVLEHISQSLRDYAPGRLH